MSDRKRRIGSIQTELLVKSQIPDVETELLEVLSVPVESVQQTKLMAINLGLDVDHNDDLIEQQNRLQLESLIESCLTHILAAWIASGYDKSVVPTAVSNARESGNLLSQDHIRSICQFESISTCRFRLGNSSQGVLASVRGPSNFFHLSVVDETRSL